MTRKQNLMHTLTLFSSMSTLVCCALPALFVALGAGAALAGIVSNVPQLVWLSEHKLELFMFAGFMLTFSGILRYRSRNAPCPTDPAQAMLCGRLRKTGGYIYFSSLALYVIGAFFAFIAPRLLV